MKKNTSGASNSAVASLSPLAFGLVALLSLLLTGCFDVSRGAVATQIEVVAVAPARPIPHAPQVEGTSYTTAEARYAFQRPWRNVIFFPLTIFVDGVNVVTDSAVNANPALTALDRAVILSGGRSPFHVGGNEAMLLQYPGFSSGMIVGDWDGAPGHRGQLLRKQVGTSSYEILVDVYGRPVTPRVLFRFHAMIGGQMQDALYDVMVSPTGEVWTVDRVLYTRGADDVELPAGVTADGIHAIRAELQALALQSGH